VFRPANGPALPPAAFSPPTRAKCIPVGLRPIVGGHPSSRMTQSLRRRTSRQRTVSRSRIQTGLPGRSLRRSSSQVTARNGRSTDGPPVLKSGLRRSLLAAKNGRADLTKRAWPRWWDRELELTPHLLKRMEDRAFHEMDLRQMLHRARSYCPDVVDGRWTVATSHGGRQWEVIVEPDVANELLVLVTAYPIRDE
jgi:hypothetical protein